MATMRKAQRLPSARTKKPDALPDPLANASSDAMDWQMDSVARDMTLRHPRVVAIKDRITRDLARVQAKHLKGTEDPMASKKKMENMESPALKKAEANMASKPMKSSKKGTKKGTKKAKMPWMK